LAQVAEVARTVASNLGTANVALSACSLPGRPPSFTLLDDEMELGLGIHGEKGYKRTVLEGVDQVAEALVNLILPQGGESGTPAGYLGDVRPDQPIALLVNSLGASTDLELGGLTLATIAALERHGFRGSLRAVLSGRLMTVGPPRSQGRGGVGVDADAISAISAGGAVRGALAAQSLEMAGFSATVLLLQPGMLEALEAPTTAPAWPQVAVGAQVSPRTYLEKPAIAVLASATDVSERCGVAGTMMCRCTCRALTRRRTPQGVAGALPRLDALPPIGTVLYHCLVDAASALIAAEPELTELDSKASPRLIGE